MNKKLSVSVGIPAYNEEVNIAHLLRALLEQKGDNFLLKEIIVISDGSEDKTARRAGEINDRRIKIVEHKERKGKALRQNEFADTFKGDILVILDADTIPENEFFLSETVKPFLDNERIGIVGNKAVPLEARTYFEKVINFSADLKQEIFEEFSKDDNLYLCRGVSRAFSRKFLEELCWPPVIGEDIFSYLQCKKSGFEFYHQVNAKILYRSPNNLDDHLKRSLRFLNTRKQMKLYFGKGIKKDYSIPFSLKLAKTTKYFLKNPILLVSYLVVLTLTRIRFLTNNQETNLLWPVATSTKQLIPANQDINSEAPK